MKHQQIKQILLGIICFLGLMSCREVFPPRYFSLENKTNKSIFIAHQYEYPDTSLEKIDKESLRNVHLKTTLPGETHAMALHFFGRNPTLQIFIFDAETVKNTPWDTIVKKNMVLKRYQITANDVERSNYRIVYDGK